MEVRVEFLKSNKVTDVNYIKLGTGPEVHLRYAAMHKCL